MGLSESPGFCEPPALEAAVNRLTTPVLFLMAVTTSGPHHETLHTSREPKHERGNV